MTWPEGRSRESTVLISPAIVALIGLLDYVLGWQMSLSAVYVYPIAIAAWYIGPRFAYLLAVLTVVLFTAGDLASDIPYSSWLIALWNGVVRLLFYAVLIHMIDYIRSLTLGLEARVLERTSDLRKEITERERLERELLEVGGRERRRLGYDLHDGLGQHLTGTALAVQVLLEKLTARHIDVVPADKVRQVLFDLGGTAVSDENKAALAEKLQVDAFLISSVGSATTDTIAIIPLPVYAGIAAPILKTSGAIELTLVAADSGRMLMHGVASGAAGFRTKKSVIASMLDQMMNRAFTADFTTAYTAKH